jgi:hypothetical protein
MKGTVEYWAGESLQAVRQSYQVPEMAMVGDFLRNTFLKSTRRSIHEVAETETDGVNAR